MRLCAKFGMPAEPKQSSYGGLSLFPHYEALNHDRAQQARVADRPCWGVFNASDFERCFPDLSMLLSQGRRLTRRPLGALS